MKQSSSLFVIILKVIKNRSFTLSLEDRFFEKQRGGQIESRVFLELSLHNMKIVIRSVVQEGDKYYQEIF